MAKIIRQDPFVSISPTSRTRVCQQGGTNPRWYDGNVLQVELANPNETVVVEVWDKEFTRANRLIACGRIELKAYEEDGAEDLPIEILLEFDGEGAGTLSCTMTYEPVVVKEEVECGLQPSVVASDSRLVAWKRNLQKRAKARPGLAALLLTLTVAQFVCLIHLWIWTVMQSFACVYGVFRVLLWYVCFPLCLVTVLPRFWAWTLTKIVFTLAHGYPITFETITIIPWIVDFKRLHFRITVSDFEIGNPAGVGFTSKFLSLERLDLIGSVSFSHLKALLLMKSEPVRLKKVPDFKRMVTLRVEQLEFIGFTLDFQTSRTSGRLNINEMTKAFAMGELNAAFRAKKIDSKPKPNMLEVRVLRARNLLAKDSNGFSDPYAVVQLRRESKQTSITMKTLNPVWTHDTFQYQIRDPSAVIHVALWDADFGKKADFLGHWVMTLKWLIMDPKHCRHVEVEKLSEQEENDGWIGMWVPLVDINYQNEGAHGDVNIRLRWFYDPTVSDVGELTPTSQSALDQITDNSNETRMRLGDIEQLINQLNHFPVLFDVGRVVVRNAKMSVHDLLRKKRKKKLNGPAVGSDGGSTTATMNQVSSAANILTSAPALIVTKTAVAVASSAVTALNKASFLPRVPPVANTAGENSPISGKTAFLGAAKSNVDAASNSFERDKPRSFPSSADSVVQFPAHSADMHEVVEAKKSPSTRLTGRLLSGSSPYASNDSGMCDPIDDPSLSRISQMKKNVRTDNDEYIDPYGRRFVQIQLIEWKKQFAPRHGDEGLPVYKVLDRFFRGLAPKLMANQKLHLKLLAVTTASWMKGFGLEMLGLFVGDMSLAAPLQKGATNVISAVVNTTKDQITFVTQKTAHHQRQTGRPASAPFGGFLPTVSDTVPPSFDSKSSPSRVSSHSLNVQTAVIDTMPSIWPGDGPVRRVTALDDEFFHGYSILHGYMQAMWVGKKRSAFSKLRLQGFPWKLWQIDIKGDNLYFRKCKSSTDSEWHVLDLDAVDVMTGTEIGEVTLKFKNDKLSLRLRETTSIDGLHSIDIYEWIDAFNHMLSPEARLGVAMVLNRATMGLEGEVVGEEVVVEELDDADNVVGPLLSKLSLNETRS